MNWTDVLPDRSSVTPYDMICAQELALEESREHVLLTACTCQRQKIVLIIFDPYL